MFKLIVGLGNPGAKYKQTRHNAGFLFVDRLAEQLGGQFSEDRKFLGSVCKTSLNGNAFWVLKPATFMNRSGQSVSAMCRYYQVSNEQLLVVHDELDLLPGSIRLKQGGGHGGHNGLRDIMAHLGGKDFYRLRIGIGHPGDRNGVSGYVLSSPGREESGLIEQAIGTGLSYFDDVLSGQLQSAMQGLHSFMAVPD